MASLSQWSVKRRTTVMLLGIFGLVLMLFGRLFYLQIIQYKKLQGMAENQRLREVPIEAKRGKILDRNGEPLAMSFDADCIYACPVQIKDKKGTAEELAQIVHIPAADLEERLQKQAAFVWIKRKASPQEVDRIRRKKLAGIEVTQKAQRFYPQKELAAQVLGISGIDNIGLEGLELYYDSYLRGVPGSEQAEYDSRGRHIPQGERRFVSAQDGDTLYLTIDESIQHIAERELEKAVRENGAKRGCVILMDPMNGDILAIANYPYFDPNQYLNYPAENRKNWAITDSYEPGSTFKVVTAATALEERVVDRTTKFFDPGYLVVEDRRLRCWRPGGHGSQSFVEATENSCNPVFASVALRIGKETFYKYIKAFGFGQATGVDFPGEAKGILQPLPKVKNVELATNGFGQGISVTPIQLVTAFSATINGGYLLEPHLVKEIRSSNGQPVKRYGRKVIRQVISESTSKELASILRSVVANGSGNNANVPGYRVAGKTGTAQKASAGNYGQGRVASFLGVAPVDSPRVAGLVILDEPSGAIRFGGVIAAPVFGNIVRYVLRYMGEPSKMEPSEIANQVEKESTHVPNLLSRNRQEAQTLLEKEGLVGRMIGDGAYVVDQQPKSGATMEKGSTVLLYFNLGEKYNKKGSNLVMPDLTGLTPEQALILLKRLGLHMVQEGSGKAVEQNPPPQNRIISGSTVKVRFAESKTKDG
ncbi:MAG TPA: penicillin-binding transpeptidase domain-containing protein [Bacillota bacterium]|nr:penicillin-binding transpeptidase domain-containing protein [Bacillota bacterium]